MTQSEQPRRARLRVPLEVDDDPMIVDLPYSLTLMVDEDFAVWFWDGDVLAVIERGEA